MCAGRDADDAALTPADAVAGALQNVRDVGGLATTDGGRVRDGVLYRSDAPVHGDRPPSVRPWPPRYVIDLRSPGEGGDDAHPLAADDVIVISSPLLADADPIKMMAAAETETLSLVSGYPTMLDNGEVIAQIASLVARADGPVLIHCSAGKDRTGAAIAVLLAAVGVVPADIVSDYVLTEANIDAVIARMVAQAPEAERAHLLESLTVRNAHLMRAPGEAIAAILDVLSAHPGGAAGWLRDRGVSDEELELLRGRLVGD
jgi:protein-tyrosine phosphatase